MPAHRVKASIKVLELSQAGSAINLKIYADDEVIGTIQIGQGSFGWKGKSKKGKSFKRISWTKFVDAIDDIFKRKQ